MISIYLNLFSRNPASGRHGMGEVIMVESWLRQNVELCVLVKLAIFELGNLEGWKLHTAPWMKFGFAN